MIKDTPTKNFGNLLIGIAACIAAISYMSKPTTNFEVVQLGTMRMDQYLLDKTGGRIWRLVCMGGSSGAECKGRVLWDEMFVASHTSLDSPVANDLKDFIAEQEQKPKK